MKTKVSNAPFQVSEPVSQEQNFASEKPQNPELLRDISNSRPSTKSSNSLPSTKFSNSRQSTKYSIQQKSTHPHKQPNSQKPTQSHKQLNPQKLAHSTKHQNPRRPHPAPRQYPAPLEHQLNLRDNRQCTYQDKDGHRCTNKRWLQFHHKIHVEHGGQDTLDNLQTLCWAHHKMIHLEKREGHWRQEVVRLD
jgi:hypothetical protein